MSKTMLSSFPLPLPSTGSPLSPATDPLVVKSAQEFLREHPPSVYTALQTTRSGTALPRLSFHAARLARGAPVISSVPFQVSPGAEQLAAACAAALKALEAGDGREAQFVPFVSCAGVDGKISDTAWLHVWCTWAQASVAPKEDGIVVEARGKKRTDAFLKNTGWVRERADLENARSSDVLETILLGDAFERDGDAPEEVSGSDALGGGKVLLEGLVSNFFVVTTSGELWTAGGDAILTGSVRGKVLEAARKLGVPVRQLAPRVGEKHAFDGAFVTNAIRMLTPVRVIRFPMIDGSPESVLPWSDRSRRIVGALRSHVVRAMEDESTPFV